MRSGQAQQMAPSECEGSPQKRSEPGTQLELSPKMRINTDLAIEISAQEKRGRPANEGEHSTIVKPEDPGESPSPLSQDGPMTSQGQDALATPDIETKRMQFALGAETMLIPQDQEEALVAMQLQDEQEQA